VHGRGIVTSRDEQGKPLRAVGTHSDLSDRKQAEERRVQLEAQLREAQKMEAIGTLAGGVAHDFNNVLAGILGNVELASQDVGEHHPARANLEQIRRASLRARNLVQQILAFSRRQPQLLVSQPLRPLVEESLTLLRATLPSSVQLHITLDDDPLHVQADATQIQQVLMNLCTNSWHALQASSGRIEIGLESVEPGELQMPADLPSGRLAHLWVGDDGCGMDAATQARIFEPFFTTKPVGQGTGLGLAVVHGIVTAHGGAIRVESAPSRGSRFHIYLPRADAATETQRPVRTAAQPPRGNGQHVLYVDDDELMVVTVQSLLQRAGYRVSTLTDGRAAVEAVRAEPGAFDLIVTDFNMPGFSGVDVVREVARIRPDLPVTISSGYISDELRGQARSLGVRGLLHKENTVEELAALVHRVLSTRPAAG
jgi:signal transduction histidine kinase/ActR/RegA family two-component response regulator